MVISARVDYRDGVPTEEKDLEGPRDSQIECPAGRWMVWLENKDLVDISVQVAVETTGADESDDPQMVRIE